jgi:hypothetical protein
LLVAHNQTLFLLSAKRTADALSLALQLKKSDSFESVHSGASFESVDEQAAAAGSGTKQAGTYATAPTYASR